MSQFRALKTALVCTRTGGTIGVGWCDPREGCRTEPGLFTPPRGNGHATGMHSVMAYPCTTRAPKKLSSDRSTVPGSAPHTLSATLTECCARAGFAGAGYISRWQRHLAVKTRQRGATSTYRVGWPHATGSRQRRANGRGEQGRGEGAHDARGDAHAARAVHQRLVHGRGGGVVRNCVLA